MAQKYTYELIDTDNSTGRFVLTRNGEYIAEFYNETDAADMLEEME